MSRILTKLILVICGLVFGWASALYSIDTLGSTAVGDTGSWRKWEIAPGTSGNTYAVAHFLLNGKVPPAQSLFRVYSNARDDEGGLLRSDCVYALSAGELGSRWWSLSVLPFSDADIQSTAVITSDEIVRASDGSMIVSVARHPIPGNWVRPATDGNMEIQLFVANDGSSKIASDLSLPTVQRVGC